MFFFFISLKKCQSHEACLLTMYLLIQTLSAVHLSWAHATAAVNVCVCESIRKDLDTTKQLGYVFMHQIDGKNHFKIFNLSTSATCTYFIWIHYTCIFTAYEKSNLTSLRVLVLESIFLMFSFFRTLVCVFDYPK